MKRVIFLGLLLFVFAVPLRAQTDSIPSGAVWNLKQCIDFALANSLTVKRSNYNVESSEVDLRQAKFSRLPSLNANASYGYSWGR
ncbi:MAG TPA: TolC family protein, partial [Ohtaekwangia sp.]|nr:TolC family protein [Ohtaekwangia sp.]